MPLQDLRVGALGGGNSEDGGARARRNRRMEDQGGPNDRVGGGFTRVRMVRQGASSVGQVPHRTTHQMSSIFHIAKGWDAYGELGHNRLLRNAGVDRGRGCCCP